MRTLTLAVLFASSIVVGASAQTNAHRLKFARGRSSTTVENSVIRGERDNWTLGAKAGQRLTVSITALEKNAVFSILDRTSQRELRGAEERRESTRWAGRLPNTGDYVITVGGTRGNASYKLHVAIR